MSRAWTKLTLFSRIVMKRCNAVEKSKNWEGDGRKKDSKGCGLLKSLLTTGAAQHEVTILETPLSRFKLI